MRRASRYNRLPTEIERYSSTRDVTPISIASESREVSSLVRGLVPPSQHLSHMEQLAVPIVCDPEPFHFGWTAATMCRDSVDSIQQLQELSMTKMHRLAADGSSGPRSSPASTPPLGQSMERDGYVLPPASVQELFKRDKNIADARSAQSRRRPLPDPEVPGAHRSQADVAADAAAGDARVRAGGQSRVAARHLRQRRRSACIR